MWPLEVRFLKIFEGGGEMEHFFYRLCLKNEKGEVLAVHAGFLSPEFFGLTREGPVPIPIKVVMESREFRSPRVVLPDGSVVVGRREVKNFFNLSPKDRLGGASSR